MAELLELAKSLGPWVALCLFFVWQSWLRENRLGEQLNKSEAFIRDTMSGLIAENTEAMNGLKGVLKIRPCLLNDEELIARGGKH